MGDESTACVRCVSKRLYAFSADARSRAQPKDLPVVCRDCGQVMVAGVAVSFPPELELQAKKLADLAETAGVEAAAGLVRDPSQRIEDYFVRVYRSAYLDGFWRALLYAQHNAKEGRIRRLRELWSVVAAARGAARTTLEIDSEAYDEFDRLLKLGAPGDDHASSPANHRPPVPSGAAPVPK